MVKAAFSSSYVTMPCKRPVDDTDVETAIQALDIKDNNWIQKFLEINKEQLALVIGHLADKGNIDNRSIKRARTQLPSFSTEMWADFAAGVDLPEEPRNLNLGSFHTPAYQLPPSFHKAVLEGSWHALDVYQEVVEQTREQSRIRIL